MAQATIIQIAKLDSGAGTDSEDVSSSERKGFGGESCSISIVFSSLEAVGFLAYLPVSASHGPALIGSYRPNGVRSRAISALPARPVGHRGARKRHALLGT